MLEFLQTGKALYVLAAICALGAATRWLTRNLYKRLIKETDNISLTKNKNLRKFKQKTETAYHMNLGIPKIKPYLERQMYDFRFLGMTFNGWNAFSNEMTLLCFLTGGAAAFGAYWYRADPYYIVLYGSMGILAGLFMILVDHSAGVVEKKKQLFATLDNYLENTLIFHLDQERDKTQAPPERYKESRENIRAIHPAEPIPIDQAEAPPKKGNARESQRDRTERMKNQLRAESLARRKGGGFLDKGRLGDGGGNLNAESGTEGSGSVEGLAAIKDVDYLKKSLEQIAASRDRGKAVKQEEDWLKDLNPDELKLIQEILREYLT